MMNEHFLLHSESAKQLYVCFAKELPIIDYHCHLSPAQIANNHCFEDLTEIWLQGDHYKWRAMRALGVPENLITGSASNQEKFYAWAKQVPLTIRNPLFHWTQMELKNTFGITEYLNENTAPAIWQNANEKLQTDSFTACAIINKNNVELVGTTDDPCDTLEFHKQFAALSTAFEMRPSFRPDPVLNIGDKESFLQYILKLEAASGMSIKDMDSLLDALQQRVDYFHAHGCRISDHGLTQMPAFPRSAVSYDQDFKKLLSEDDFVFPDPEGFSAFILWQLCKMYHAKNWVQQFHLGAIRNLNSRLRKLLGADSGVDSIGDDRQAMNMALFFDRLDKENQLTKTIIYNLNPSLNEVFAGIAGTFNDGTVAGKIQFGTAWWFLDQKDGIEKQLNTLSSLGILSNFIGMTTDSRSFLSYSRHDYFRRILCNLLGQEMENGELPNDLNWIGGIVEKICYSNAKQFLNHTS